MIKTGEIAKVTDNLTSEQSVQPVSRTFRNILRVVFLIFIFAVVQMLLLWWICNIGMKNATTLENQGLPMLYELAALQENLATYRLDSYEYLFAQEGEKISKAKAAEAVAVQMHTELEKIKTLLPEGEGQQLTSKLEGAIDDLDNEFRKVRSLTDSDFAAAMKAMDQDIPPRTERVAVAADALKYYGYHFSKRQAQATFNSFGWIKKNAILFGAGNILVAFGAVMFVLLAARRSRAQLSETLARLDERTKELGYERDLLRALMDSSPDPVYFKDAQSRFLIASKAHADIFGLKSADELLGKTDFDFFAEEHARPAFNDEQEIIRTGVPLIGKVEKEVLKNGRESWALTSKIPLRNKDGQIIGTFGISKDITAIKETEAKLEQMHEQLQWKNAFLEAQVNSSIEGIMVIDPQNRKILQNQRTVDLYKIPPDIAEDKDYEQQLRWITGIAKNPEHFVEKIRFLLANPCEISNDEIELKDGTVLERYSAPVMGQDGKYYGRLWTFRDITDRKRLEAQLFQSQKMETVGKLAGGIAHEFNSILTAIIGQSELLLGNLPAGSPLAKSATEISKAAGRAATLTRQLLAYGRKQFLQPEVLDLNRIVTGMENMLQHIIGGRVDTLIIPAPGLQAVKVDAGQIEQVIINMAVNAFDAMPNGGKLTLETANVSFGSESVGRYPELQPGDYVMLAITDNGTGMSAEVKARLFEPFFSTKGVGKGTGLGLSTCYGIIKQSGGHISVYSELGRGTTFKIYLPQVEPQTKIPVQRLDSLDLPRGTETILLVEDDPALREMAASLLRRLGYAVLTAANGIEALSLQQQRDMGHIDLLFTDVVMPQMSGQELADRVQALYPQTRILFTSAYTENAIIHQGVVSKGVAFLQKPFTPSALARKVREMLDIGKTDNL